MFNFVIVLSAEGTAFLAKHKLYPVESCGISNLSFLIRLESQPFPTEKEAVNACLANFRRFRDVDCKIDTVVHKQMDSTWDINELQRIFLMLDGVELASACIKYVVTVPPNVIMQ